MNVADDAWHGIYMLSLTLFVRLIHRRRRRRRRRSSSRGVIHVITHADVLLLRLWRIARARRGIPHLLKCTRYMNDAPGPNERANDDTLKRMHGDVDMTTDDTRVVSEVKRESGACP